ncbi:hypothetical protein PVAG01_07146 [Phlyctema vagabunda]|uniref:Uncharacterized protein n=1 Tax=Phlyctema vagabunda TaxID=108571 RepID=A0ABR4PBL8_9HELO
MAAVPRGASVNAGIHLPSSSQFRTSQFYGSQSGTPTQPQPSNATAGVSPSQRHQSIISQELTSSLSNEQMLRGPRKSVVHNNTQATITATPPNQSTSNGVPDAGHDQQTEALELSSTPITEGVLGPNKDGRVRNPVPSKLKNKTDGKKGTFGVMHMDLTTSKKGEIAGKDIAAERDAAARRTSEKTASAAKAAQQEGYVPPRKRKIGGVDDMSHHDKQKPGRPLAPDETKYEQARLLTLLRSINPVTVVDQLCKAVAYFGGIPGAPPPEDGIFPESANTRETGALFIGWLSEIFPDLAKAQSPEIPKLQDPPKKVRGRHRKDDDMEQDPADNNAAQGHPPAAKGPQVARPSWARHSLVTTADSGWPNGSDMTSQPSFASPQISNSMHGVIPNQDLNQTASSEIYTDSPNPVSAIPNNLQVGQVGQVDPGQNETPTGKRGRGRPKGSRKKKPEEQKAGDPIAAQKGSEQGLQTQGNTTVKTAPIPTLPPKNQPQDQSSNSNAGVSTEDEQRALIAHQQSLLFGKPIWGNETQKSNAKSSVSAAPQIDGLSPEELAVLEAFRNQRANGTVSIDKDASSSAPVATGTKRKRPTPAATPTMNKQRLGSFQAEAEPITIPTTSTTSSEIPTNIAKEALQWDSMDTARPAPPPPVDAAKEVLQWDAMSSTITPKTTPVMPAAKRQRKPKDPNAPPARKRNASVASKATPPSLPSTIPDSTAASSQQSTQVSRPPAEGLEAHYERFSNLQHQTSRSHTPTISHRPNGSQSSSVGVQRQSTPSQTQQSLKQQQQQALQKQQQQAIQTQQQQQQPQQSQQQLSQTADKTVDKNLAQTTTRPASTSSTYYNQTRYTPYSQQYNSQQQSQQYGTQSQASPQLSNSTTSNSYRTNSTHTMARASPQFTQSQTDNVYRTASPHTIPQTSPSYSQAEPNYRTTSAHSISQPSPLFSPRVSQTQASQQQTPQSHYGHFQNSSFLDLPTLDSLDHSTSAATSTLGLGSGTAYAQQGMGSARAATNGVYGSAAAAGLSNSYDSSSSDAIRDRMMRVSQSGNNTGYTAFDSEQDIRDRLLRGLGHR